MRVASSHPRTASQSPTARPRGPAPFRKGLPSIRERANSAGPAATGPGTVAGFEDCGSVPPLNTRPRRSAVTVETRRLVPASGTPAPLTEACSRVSRFSIDIVERAAVADARSAIFCPGRTVTRADE